jgi:DNA repair protein RadC
MKKNSGQIKEDNTYRISDMVEAERPREKLAGSGPSSLSNAELIAILLRVGMEGENAIQMGSRLLIDFKGLKGLYRASYPELCAVHGLGPAKAAQLMAAMELGKRIGQMSDERRSIHSPQDVYDLVGYEMSLLDQEELWVLLLDTRNQVISLEKLYRGSVNSSQVRVAEVFKASVRANTPSIIVVHNHPSGDPTPSPEDIALTRSIIQSGRLLDIELLDHIVIGQNRCVSMKERHLGFSPAGLG